MTDQPPTPTRAALAARLAEARDHLQTAARLLRVDDPAGRPAVLHMHKAALAATGADAQAAAAEDRLPRDFPGPEEDTPR